jgi:hypothetical protein
MRAFKLLLAAGAVLAITLSAGATIDLHGYSGPLYMHISDFDSATTYSGFLANGTTPVTVGTSYTPSQLQTASTPSRAQPGESSWGIFQIDSISSASITGPNGITIGSTTLYDKGLASTGNYDIVGIFYGGADQTVVFSTDPITHDLVQNITSSGYNFEIFTQPKGTWDPTASPALGAGARIDLNEFPTIGYNGTGTNTLLPGADRVITGTSQPGMVASEFFSTFDPSQISGTFDVYMSVGPVASGVPVGTMNGVPPFGFNDNIFPCGGFTAAVPGTTADFRLDGHTDPTNFAWTVHSSDPVTTAFEVVPEPVTMVGAFLGLCSAGGYLRRRLARQVA